ncbi:MAG: arginase family protein [Bacteroidales bacterium]|nr:arginase family protein [Bacteroidales bacterium]
MLDLNDYFDPVSIEKPLWAHLAEPSRFSHNLVINTENRQISDPGAYRLAIIGVPDDRRSPNKGCAGAPDEIRADLYQLSRLPGKIKMADLGNLKKGVSFDDSLAALSDVTEYLVGSGIFPLVIGGSSTLIPAMAKKIPGKLIYSTVDSRVDWVNERKEKDSFNYLPDIINKDKNPLNLLVVGYQTFLNDPQVINRFRKMKYDMVRIGEVREDIHEIEPSFRDSNLITFDIASVRQADAPGTFAPSANGFYGEEICLLSRYAGLSDSLKAAGFFEVNPLLDNRRQTTTIAAQMIWFFLEGFIQKQNESSVLEKENSGRFVNYHVSIEDSNEDLVFIKSTITNRWWIEYTSKKGEKHFIACSYNDYLQAGENEIPARYLKAVERIN